MWRAREAGRNVQLIGRTLFARPCIQFGYISSIKPSRFLSPSQQSFDYKRSLLPTTSHRNLSVHHRLLERPPPKTYFTLPEAENKSRPKFIRRTFKVVFKVFLGIIFVFIIIDISPYRETIEYPIIEASDGTEAADLNNYSPLRAALGWEPWPVFKPSASGEIAIFFIVVGIEEVSPTSHILTLRPRAWWEYPEKGQAGDPYERYSKRGPWGVEIEEPTGMRKFYTVLTPRPDDVVGDLRIMVDCESAEEDIMASYVAGRDVGDWVLVLGPRRENTIAAAE
ncbi:uncharacterized protein PAC_14532 [Phialocephala subalpina]|uniref:Uncharacterized protein n=1 Tax=Phialocephala subalpina TaxID=576137 RepID=A0A1L7XHY1_9HELO|nr:uncharacterized protein PAC_14532 [Phialocephala subalpina]